MRKPLRIGPLSFEYPFVLAPLAGITDKSMRSLCCQAGASLTYTEMVSAKGLWYGDRKTGELLAIGEEEGPVGFQLFGSEPEILGYAVRLLSDPAHAKAVDAEMAEWYEAAAAEESGHTVAGAIDSFDPAAMEESGHITAGAIDNSDPAAVIRPPHIAANRAPMGARTAAGLRPPALFDLNAGCPVPKIVRNGEGSALLKDPELFYDCVSAMCDASKRAAADRAADNSEAAGADSRAAGDDSRAAGDDSRAAGARNCAAPKVPEAAAAQTAGAIPVTVKIRKGFERDEDCAVEIAKAAEAAGAAAVTVHGRTRQQFYEGEADWGAIARVKAAVKIPVIGNGDVHSGRDAIRMMEETGCDGVMIARGALGNPWIFQEACALWRGDGDFIPPTDEERIRQLLHHLDLVCEDKGERVAVREMRKHVGWYIKGMRGATQIRRRINTAATAAEMRQILTGK